MSENLEHKDRSDSVDDGRITRREFESQVARGALALSLTSAATADNNPAMAQHHEATELEALWEAQQETCDAIAKQGLQRYVSSLSLEDQQAMFYSQECVENCRCVACADERIRTPDLHETQPVALIRVAGSWILEASQEPGANPLAPSFVRKIATRARAQGIKIFTGHYRCGAAKLAFIAYLEANGRGNEVMDITDDKVKDFNQQFVNAVVAEMKTQAEENEREEIRADFIDKLDGPEDFHPGRAIVIDETGTYDSSNSSLPVAFVETIVDGNIVRTLGDVDVLISKITMSDHGWNKKFTEKPSEQLLVLCVAKSEASLKTILDKARAFVASKPWAKQVRVEGMVR